MTVQASAAGTWGIRPKVRRAIANAILELRGALEDDFRRQLAALGIRESGIQPMPPGRTLAALDERARGLAVAVIQQAVAGGATHAEALAEYVRESAFTFLNRIVGLRCIEERGLLLVDGQPETAVKRDPARNASSLYWRVRNELPPTTDPRDVWRETLRRANAAVSQQVRLLFDPDAEHAALLPLRPTLQKIVDLLNAPEIPTETYAEDELLGWVYQYYSSAEKDAVYARLAKGKKIERPEELAAASCLYTERYMVDYLLQNTLGALWVEQHSDTRLPETWPYYVRPPGSQPEAGGNNGDTPQPPPLPLGEGWNKCASRGEGSSGERESQTTGAANPGSAPEPAPPRRVRDITLLDPTCGSGHFLVRAFDLFTAMYREEGIEPETEIPILILERNLHGIDIDPRSIQIAALALYLKGCALAGPDFRPRRLNLLSTDVTLPGNTPPPELLARFPGDKEMEALVAGIWQELANASEFGSLLHPERAIDEMVQRRREREKGGFWEAGNAEWECWKADLLASLREEFEQQAQSEDLGQRLFGEEAARGVSLIEALGRRYDIVVMNPPFAGSTNLNSSLKRLIERAYKDGRRDLYAAFILRCHDFCRVGGYAGMVTQQSWMFLRSYANLRKRVLEEISVTTLTHLGPRAFEEIGGEVVNVALFTIRAAHPRVEHRVAAYRLVGLKSPLEKDALLRRALVSHMSGVASTPRQAAFRTIPETPFVYWLRPRFFELLQNGRRLRDLAEAKQGLATADNERFTRYFWEIIELGTVRDGKSSAGRWFWYAKGGRYQKWAGLEWLVVDWEDKGQRIKTFYSADGRLASRPQNEAYYFRSGLTYSPMGRGSMGTRLLRDSVFDVKGASIFSLTREASLVSIAGVLSSRLNSYLLRVATQYGEMHVGYVASLPLPEIPLTRVASTGAACIAFKQQLVGKDPLERSFKRAGLENPRCSSALERYQSVMDQLSIVETMLHMAEGLNERFVCDSYGLDETDVQAVLDETGTPADWYPLLAGYDATLSLPKGVVIPLDFGVHLADHERRVLDSKELGQMQARVRVLYQAGPGRSAGLDYEDSGTRADDEATLGASIPIPAETFMEELSQRLEVHPISVYWLLKEMREQEGLVSPPELKRQIEDYASVTVLRQLGYRWPEQDAYEREHGPIMDPSLVDQDGIIPLVACGDQPTAEQRVRARLERDFGEEGAAQSLQEFRQWVGRDLGDWLRRDFFKRHVQQFKQRPIAWHLVSPERTFEAFVLYHRLSRATLQSLRARYAGELIARLRVEQGRARERKDAAAVGRSQLQIEDVEEVRARLEAIERGDELKYRIRCRWKGETETGRPGPYAPDIDDGVKVNIRPFQEAGLLAVRQVIKKW